MQYHRQVPLLQKHRRALAFHAHVIMQVPPKQAAVTRKPERQLVIYSDAEFEPESGRRPQLGWVLFPTDDSRPLGQAMVLPQEIWDTWTHRHQQIFPAEAVVLTLATWSLHSHMRGRDIVWFIDNEAAASCAIRGCSGLPEVETAVQAAHLLWLHLGCRVWVEWVDSKSNPSDGLSRLGVADPWTVSQNWHLSKPCDPPWHEDVNHPDALFQALWNNIGQGGGP